MNGNAKWVGLILVLALVTTAYAAVELTILIPNAYVARIVPAIEAGQDAHIHVHIQGSQGVDPNTEDYSLFFDFRSDREPGEDTKTYYQNVLKRFTLAWTRAHEKKLNELANKVIMDALPPTDSNLPDDAVQ